MELQYLKEFILITENGGYTQAANKSGMAQSLLSKHMKSLETEMDIRLFERKKRTLELTEDGKRFLKYAQKTINLWDEYGKQNGSLKKRGTIRIGTIPTVSSYGIDSLLAGFLREYPEISLQVTEKSSEQLLDQLKNGQQEFVFLKGMDYRPHRINSLLIKRDNLVVICPNDHMLAGQHSVKLADLKDEEFIVSDKQYFSYRKFMESCEAAGFEPEISYISNNDLLSLQMVRGGHGIAVLSEAQVKAWNRGNCASVLQLDPPIAADIRMVWKADREESECAEIFLSYIKRQLQIPDGITAAMKRTG